MILNAFEGKPLPVYGDGLYVRDWIHVEDHCEAIDLVARGGKAGEVYNVGGGNERENIWITHRILEATGAGEGLITHVEDRLGHDVRYSLDTTKLRSMGWAPEVDLEQGLQQTVQWYMDNRSWWEPIKSGEFRAFYEQQYKDRLAAR